MYQFVFMNMETSLPFTLHTMLRQHILTLSSFTADDLLCDRSLRGTIVMVQDACEVDFDVFFNLLDEVSSYSYNNYSIVVSIANLSKLFT